MKLTALFALLMALNLNAQNLAEILDALKTSKKVQVILEKTKADKAQNELMSLNEAPELGLGISHAKDSAESGLEYAVGFSQTLWHPFSASSRDSGVNSLAKAIEQSSKYQLHILELEVVSRYHQTCVSKEMRNKSKLLFTEQSRRFEQLKKAYELGEISRKNLLFNKLDLVKLKQRLSSNKKRYFVEFSNLQESIDSMLIDEVSCDDMIPLTRNVELRDISEHGELKEIEYKQNSSKAFYNMYDSFFDSLGYELMYEQELDTKRYSVGINIPLGSLSSQKEKQKAHYLHMNSAYTAEKDSKQEHINNVSSLLQLKLKVLYSDYLLLKLNILPLNLELVKLSKSAYAEGEGTIMEYLDATRSYSENLLEMLEIKKNYYKELFELYKKADLKLGEIYEKTN